MKIKSLLFLGALTLAGQANAQNWVEDSVTMGQGYANDVFYSLKNGTAKVESNTNWHIAFQMTPQGPYGNVSVFANHVQAGVNVYPLHVGATGNFANLGAADTAGKTSPSMMLFNSDTSWNFGALNSNRNPANVFDYGWGIYHQVPYHDVDGDSVYLITVATGPTTFDAYKIWIQRYRSAPLDSTSWRFRVAKLDGSEDTTIQIYRSPDYTNRLFVYYNLATQEFIDREPNRPDWDLLFTRYREDIPGAPGGQPYPVMGVLSNFDVAVAEIHNIGPDDTTGFKNFQYATSMKTIGSDWKVFDMTQTPPAYVLDDSTYYFVKTKNTNEYYQLQFTSFGGSSNGKTVFKTRFLGVTTGLSDVNASVNAYFVAPNPAGNETSIMIDAKEQSKNAQLLVTDITGKTVYHSNVIINAGLNTFRINTANLASGTYIAVLTNGSWKVAEKLTVQH